MSQSTEVDQLVGSVGCRGPGVGRPDHLSHPQGRLAVLDKRQLAWPDNGPLLLEGC
jgi:hypothetical protein